MTAASPPPASVTVAICCHNGRDRLPRTLEHLAHQQNVADVTWDVLVVDNASTDGSAAAARDLWSQLGAPAPFRVVPEIRLGLQYARIRAVQSSTADAVSFVDDDNWVAPDWVARVARLIADHPAVGACGGRSEAVFDSVEPAWFAAVAASYAVGSQHDRSGVLPADVWALWGTGLTVRRAAVLAALAAGWTPRLACRRGAALSSGGDYELCLVIRLAGYALYYDPALWLRHHIPARKSNWGYAVDLARGFGEAGVDIFKYAHAAGLAGASWGRMISVPSWTLEVLRAAAALIQLAALAALGRRSRPDFGRLWALKAARLKTLIRSRAAYVDSFAAIAALARRLRHA